MDLMNTAERMHAWIMKRLDVSLYEVTYIGPNGYSRYTMRVLAHSAQDARKEVEARTGCHAVPRAVVIR